MDPSTEFNQITTALGVNPQQQKLQAAAVAKALDHGLTTVDVLALVAKYQQGAYPFLLDVFTRVEARTPPKPA